jgi:thiosulfate reductase cytochrome b subunit
MTEHTDSVSTARPRRGLPRRAEEYDAVADGVSSETTTTEASEPETTAAPVAAAKPRARRTGLPRANSAVASDTPSPATAAAQPKSGRRAGLPRPGSSAPEAPAVPTDAPAASADGGSRRAGLPKKAGEGAHAATSSATLSSPAPQARRAGLAKPAASSPAPSVPAAPSAPAAASTTAPESKTKPLPLKIAGSIVALFILAGVLVLAAQWLRTLEPVQNFITAYPGESHLPEKAPVGLPAWLGWQHFLNAFFIVLIIRTGWQVRTQQRPPATWIRNNEGLLKTKNPPKKISLTLWAHLTLDILWFVNGIVFVVLLFATGQWMRVVPTSWDVFPNAISALIQYISLDWPVENGWVNYNSLQLLAYFTTIFIAAPLAAVTGVRMSGAWPAKAEKLNKIYPMELARAIHFPVMLYFTLFVVVHVFLVFATGALRNLNHMYASQDTTSWTGFWIFFASLVVMAGAIVAARPLVLAPIAQLMGRVGR